MSHVTNYTIQLIISISPLLLYKLKIIRKFPIEALFYFFIISCTGITIYRGLQGYGVYYFGIFWHGALYYLLSLVILFRFIRDRFDPMRAVFGSLFTVWTSSIVWEMPSYVWHLCSDILSSHFWWNFGLCLLIVPAFSIFNLTTSLKKILIFFVSMIPSTIEALVFGPSWIYFSGNIIWLQLVWFVCRAITLFGLYQLMWSERKMKKTTTNDTTTTESKKSLIEHSGYTCSEMSDFWGNGERGRIVLDLGSGPGDWSRFLNNEGYDVVAADINKDIFLLGNYEGVVGLVCDAQHLPFRCNVFSNVFCMELLEHLHEPGKCIMNVSYVLRPGGEVG